jgi:hypothetical protein
MPENPNPDHEPQDPFNNPKGEVLIAYVELDELLTMWMKYHPNVSREDIDKALDNFNEAVRKRDEQSPPQ